MNYSYIRCANMHNFLWIHYLAWLECTRALKPALQYHHQPLSCSEISRAAFNTVYVEIFTGHKFCQAQLPCIAEA